MASQLPPRFVDLYKASTRAATDINIMGVVTDYMPPKPTRQADWMCTFSIADRTLGGIGQQGSEGLKVRFFKAPNEMPPIQGTGDVVVLRHMNVKSYQGMLLALSSYLSTWTVIPASSIPEETPTDCPLLKHSNQTRATSLSTSEMMYAIELCNLNDRSSYTSPPAGLTSTPVLPTLTNAVSCPREKSSLIKDVEVQTYYDLVGQVVKIFSRNECLELYITDYTTNPLLWNYAWGDEEGSGREGDEFNYASRKSADKQWPGPYGKQTLTVSMWSPNLEFAREHVQCDDFVHLRNVRVIWSQGAKLEGRLHSDNRHGGQRIDVTVKNNEDDDRVKDVLRRKRDYWKKAQAQAPNFVKEVRGLKRKDATDGNPESKTQARKRRKQEREQALKSKCEEANKENNSNEPPETNDTTSTKQPKAELLNKNGNLATFLSFKTSSNKRTVKCAHHLYSPQPLSAITSLAKHANKTPKGTIYTLPFQNLNYRATVCIVDFHPRNIADFAVPILKADEYAILSDAEDEASSDSDSGPMNSGWNGSSGRNSGVKGWEWRFSLTLEEALGPKGAERATLEAYVAGQDAECLLKLDAEDLRKSPEALAGLREKLFLLWGDLEGRKSKEEAVLGERDGNRSLDKKKGDGRQEGVPFQCCLKQYGVRVRAGRNENDEIPGGSDGHKDINDEWRWERRFRLYGCTII